MNINEMQLYDAIGEDGFARLVAAFYAQIPNDDILGPIYPADDLPGAEQRLCDFLVGRFGGPPRYIEQRGHPRLRMRHAPFVVNAASRDRWLLLMNNAFTVAALPQDAEAILRPFFLQVANFMINQPE